MRTWYAFCRLGTSVIHIAHAKKISYLIKMYECTNNFVVVLGKGGVTHNMLDDIHNHWKRAEAVRIKCLGVPTLDMHNVCFHLEV